MLSKLIRYSFFTAAAVSFLSALALIFPAFFNTGSEPVGVTEIVFATVPKVLLVISALFLYQNNRKGLYFLFSAFTASITHSVYVLFVLENGKRYVTPLVTDPVIYWVFKGTFYIIPLVFYLVWSLYWNASLKHNKQRNSDSDTVMSTQLR